MSNGDLKKISKGWKRFNINEDGSLTMSECFNGGRNYFYCLRPLYNTTFGRRTFNEITDEIYIPMDYSLIKKAFLPKFSYIKQESCDKVYGFLKAIQRSSRLSIIL